MEIAQDDITKAGSKEIRVLLYVLLVYAIYSVATASYTLIEAFIWPRFFADTNSLSPWPFVLLTVPTTLLNLIVAGLSCVWIKARQPRGWWLSGALFSHWVIISPLTIYTLLMSHVGLDNQSLFMMNPKGSLYVCFLLICGLWMFVHLSKKSVLNAFNIDAGKRSSNVGKLFFSGLLFSLLHVLIGGVAGFIVTKIMD